MPEPVIVSAEETPPEDLDAFLRQFFKQGKCDFLRDHGGWWHRHPRNRMVALQGGAIAGYCAVIPTRCLVAGRIHDALWWVDLVVAPEFRGLGVQRQLDLQVLDRATLLLGFPNQLAAQIHRKHGWGVREDHRLAILPFDASTLRRDAGGVTGALSRVAGTIGRPAAALLRWRLKPYRPRTARPLDDPDAAGLASVFERHRPAATITTWRDADYLRWRYLEAPYRNQLRFYVAGGAEAPSIAAVTRTLVQPQGRVARLLDLFGDLDDPETVKDLLRLIARDAAAAGCVQLTAYLSLPRLESPFRAAGLLFGLRGRSCWHCSDPRIRLELDTHDRYWCLGDSDNDSHA